MEPAGDQEEPVVPQRASFFDTLPPEVLRTLLRYVSERPGADEWLAAYDHVDVFTVLDTNALADAGRQSFTDMRLGLSASALHSVDAVSTKFMRSQAPALRSLSIDNWASRTLDYSAMGNCVNLRRLTLDEDIWLHFNYAKFEAVFIACGATLQQLCVQVEDRTSMRELLDYAGKYCGALEVLDVWHLSKLSPVMPLLGTSRSTLRRLRTGNEIERWTDRELRTMVGECTNLQIVEMPHQIARPVCELLGNRLRVLVVSSPCWNSTNLSSALKHCPNAEVEGTIPFDANMLRVCSPRIRTAVLSGTSFTSVELNQEHGGVRDSFFWMFNLEEVTIQLEGENSVALVNAFFAKTKYRLKKLELVSIKDACIMEMAANRTVAVEEFKCTTEVALSGEKCVPFLTSNKNLTSIDIVLENAMDVEESEIELCTANLVRSLNRCKRLTHFYIRNQDCTSATMKTRSAVIEDGCVALRWRGVNVEIGGVRYLPVYKPVQRSATLYV